MKPLCLYCEPAQFPNWIGCSLLALFLLPSCSQHGLGFLHYCLHSSSQCSTLWASVHGHAFLNACKSSQATHTWMHKVLHTHTHTHTHLIQFEYSEMYTWSDIQSKILVQRWPPLPCPMNPELPVFLYLLPSHENFSCFLHCLMSVYLSNWVISIPNVCLCFRCFWPWLKFYSHLASLSSEKLQT